jgi:hypothetical protein
VRPLFGFYTGSCRAARLKLTKGSFREQSTGN